MRFRSIDRCSTIKLRESRRGTLAKQQFEPARERQFLGPSAAPCRRVRFLSTEVRVQSRLEEKVSRGLDPSSSRILLPSQFQISRSPALRPRARLHY